MIKVKQFGKHENVLMAEFGTGDICFTKARFPEQEHESLVLFHNNFDGHEIGDTSHEWNGRTSDEIERPEFVLVFNKPESITALVQTLLDLQMDMMKKSGKPQQA